MIEKFKLEDEVLGEYGVGYVPDKRFNEKFREQGLDCPYEHCMETMPSQEDESIDAVKKGMIVDIRKDPAFMVIGKTRIKELPKEEPELYCEIRKILDKRGIEDEACWFFPDLNKYITEFGNSPLSCGRFRHYCPSGEEQVNLCKGKMF